jgi:hypothetical protein
MVTESTNGRTEVFIKGTGLKTKFLVMENIFGMIKEHIKDIGKIIICMVKEFTNGPMEENTKAII